MRMMPSGKKGAHCKQGRLYSSAEPDQGRIGMAFYKKYDLINKYETWQYSYLIQSFIPNNPCLWRGINLSQIRSRELYYIENATLNLEAHFSDYLSADLLVGRNFDFELSERVKNTNYDIAYKIFAEVKWPPRFSDLKLLELIANFGDVVGEVCWLGHTAIGS